jgi:hypothetical protein
MGILIDKSPQLIRFDEEGSTAAKAAIISLVDVKRDALTDSAAILNPWLRVYFAARGELRQAEGRIEGLRRAADLGDLASAQRLGELKLAGSRFRYQEQKLDELHEELARLEGEGATLGPNRPDET